MFRLRVVHDGEQIAAHAVHHGLDYAQGGVRGYGRIHCASALRQYGCPGLGGYSLAGSHDAILRHHHGAGLLAGRVVRRPHRRYAQNHTYRHSEDFV